MADPGHRAPGRGSAAPRKPRHSCAGSAARRCNSRADLPAFRQSDPCPPRRRADRRCRGRCAAAALLRCNRTSGRLPRWRPGCPLPATASLCRWRSFRKLRGIAPRAVGALPRAAAGRRPCGRRPAPNLAPRPTRALQRRARSGRRSARAALRPSDWRGDAERGARCPARPAPMRS